MIKSNSNCYINRRHIDVINKLYYSVLSAIKVMTLNKKIIRETGYELFEQEWEEYSKSVDIVIKKLIDSPYILIPFNLEDSINDFPPFLKLYKTDSEIFKANLMAFMEIHDLRIGIYRDGETIKSKFPISLCEQDLIVGHKYYLKGKFYLDNY
jgi:hypothetical protein